MGILLQWVFSAKSLVFELVLLGVFHTIGDMCAALMLSVICSDRGNGFIGIKILLV